MDAAIGSEFVIVAANGAEVKCHKRLLMESSPVLRAMFENNMTEGTTNRLEMPDMTEAGVRALLRFIYYGDLKAAEEKCDIALELFQAGHKYGLTLLKNRVETLILSKPVEWFNLDMGIRFAVLSQDMEENEEIFKKTAIVVLWYGRNSNAELLASKEYEGLFQNHPQLAMKLGCYFLQLS